MTTNQIKNSELETLRIEIKKTIIDLRLDRKGVLKFSLLPLINEKLGKKVNVNAFYMALGGQRNDNASANILKALQEVLQSMLPDQAA
ncbi:MAG: hypothetical protein WCJ37_03665 [Syntrophus sp. (in: bacteria)]